jgi:hypothetical protein
MQRIGLGTVCAIRGSVIMPLELLELRIVLACDITVHFLAGDVNTDGIVDFADFLVLSENFNKTDEVARADGDLDGDGKVGFGDFLILSSDFGNELAEDINRDGRVTRQDAYELRDTVLAEAAYDEALDLNADGILDRLDVQAVAAVLRQQHASSPPTDINLDCETDEKDAAIIDRNFGQQVIGGWIDGDLDGDGEVGFPDLLALDPSPF